MLKFAVLRKNQYQQWHQKYYSDKLKWNHDNFSQKSKKKKINTYKNSYFDEIFNSGEMVYDQMSLRIG